MLDWLVNLLPNVFTFERNDFACGSLSAIYAYIAATYLKWVGTVGPVKAKPPRLKVSDVGGLREAFNRVDATLSEAFGTFTAWDELFDWTSPASKTSSLTRRWLILHPINHP